MPGTPRPVGQSGPYPPHWNAVMQALQATAQKANAIVAGSTQGYLVDQYGNIIEVAGTNIAQVVTIGAAFQQPGVQVSTLWPSGTAGRKRQTNQWTGTVTTTKGSTSATLVSTISGSLLTGTQVAIGAASVTDPSTGIATPAITPGTYVGTLVGSTITLSQAAAESGTGIYAASCTFN